MDSKADLRTFPKDANEALALLYLQNQDLSGLTPEELYDQYKNAHDRIRQHRRNTDKPQRTSY